MTPELWSRVPGRWSASSSWCDLGLAVIVPSLALTVRRLHDVNFSGWMILIGLVPFLGGLALLVFTILPSKPEGQRFDVPA